MWPRRWDRPLETAQGRAIVPDFQAGIFAVTNDVIETMGGRPPTFGLRRDHVLIEIPASFPDRSDRLEERRHQHWVRDTRRAFEPIALPGGYPNLLGTGEADRAAASFGPNAERLAVVKRRYDPGNVFSSAIPPPRNNSQAFADKQEVLRRTRARRSLFDSDERRLRAAHRARASVDAAMEEGKRWKWKCTRKPPRRKGIIPHAHKFYLDIHRESLLERDALFYSSWVIATEHLIRQGNLLEVPRRKKAHL